MKSTKKIALTGMLAALYFVLSLSLKIPVAGNISLDLGYIALTVAAAMLGALPAALVGATGAALESILLSPFGLSIGWTVMNFFIGLLLGWLFYNHQFWKRPVIAILLILIATFGGIALKTVIECLLYNIPLLVKLPKSATAFVIDSLVMVLSLPLVTMIQNRRERG